MMDISASQPLPSKGFLHALRRWWRIYVVKEVDHQEVVDRVREDDGWSPRYAFMLLMSAGIAVLGLLLSSPAVVIGAMLISPLMGPIVGFGFALATVDSAEIRRTLATLAGGALIAVAFTALIVMLSPLQTVTAEIAARTRPNLFDLLVALFSALAGAYAMIRSRQGTIVGVAIATALMPPLATVGFGLATLNMTVLMGAFLLFFTNFVTISLAAAVMARLYGFGRALSPRQTAFQSVFIIGIFLCLAIPLGFSLRQIAWEAQATRDATDIITGQFSRSARISQIDLDFNATPMVVHASVLTEAYSPSATRDAERMLSRMLHREVRVDLEQIRVSADTESAQLLQAQASSRAAQSQIDRLADRLALVAGVPADAVTIDSSHKRAIVRAKALPDAGLAAYQALEARAAEAASGWQVMVQPPTLPLPPVAVDAEGKPTDSGRRALDLAIWAALRVGAPVGVAGTGSGAEAVLRALLDKGIDAHAVEGGSNNGNATDKKKKNNGTNSDEGEAVTLSWQAAITPAG